MADSWEAADAASAAEREILLNGTPDEKINTWLKLTKNDQGRLKAGEWMRSLIPNLKLVSTNPTGPHPSCTFAYTVQPENCNRLDNLHGGCAATLFDFSTTLPLALVNRPGFWEFMGVSRTLNVTYMRPVPVGEEVLLECEIVQVGRKLATLRGVMRRRSDNALLAVCEHGKRMAADTMLLINLPAEVLQLILQWLDPADIILILPQAPGLRQKQQGAVPCRLPETLGMKRYCIRNPNIKCAINNLQDTPQDLDLDWCTEIHDLVRLEAICRRSDAADKVVNRLLSHASASLETPPGVRSHATSINVLYLNQILGDKSNLEAFLQRSFLFERVRNELHHPIRASGAGSSKALLHQRSAKLHCLYGKPILSLGSTRASRTYPYACSKVYDLRQYTERTHWGPFLDDGSDRVDWEKVEAILIVLAKNIGTRRFVSDLFREVWDSPFSGSWPGSYLGQPSPALTSLESRDPYDVTGTCYNFPAEDLIGRDTPRPALDVGEATRILQMNLKIHKIEPPGPDDGQDLPVVHFKGVTRSLDDSFDGNGNSQMRGWHTIGTVRLTREGEVRWTTFSIFNGQERWRSEGIQVGGVRSARGVVGNWFDRDYDAHGPAGPTAFWKGPTRDRALPQDDMLPNDFFVPYAILLHVDGEDEDDDDEYGDDEDDPEEDVQRFTVTVDNRPQVLEAEPSHLYATAQAHDD
ncbi:hypothetical protein BGZ61DRAFT_489774 [Ilyonectria robusta]|uniref:uncharacterized protein n=1 Tax=Ilyonectria robusta TaxID=1079257 RepID=UPI001E8DCCB3|nr:uncharacterized protein BGZ61DRAFT_489774 [Ilyonectria robusta]KAH8735958.1 hypothetical protein BGZ61DRAFT_489774 [Ilyonectria robusta]